MSLRCCLAANPLASDYQRYLEPIQCVDVEGLSRLPEANEIGRVGRQVTFVFIVWVDFVSSYGLCAVKCHCR